METVYADSLIFLNTVVNYAVLLSAGRLCALPLRRGRMALAALLGGVYALCTVIRPAIFATAAAKLGVGALMAVLAFGIGRRTLRAVLAVYAVAAAFGGVLYAVSRLSVATPGGAVPALSPRVLLLSFALSYAAISLVFRRIGRRPERTLCLVELRLGGSAVSFSALLDSGNELCDPVSGDPVLIADAQTLAPLFPESTPLRAPDPLAALESLSAQGIRCRLIPCACVAADTALLLCFRPDSVRVDGHSRTLLIGISPNRLSPDGEYQAIIAQ